MRRRLEPLLLLLAGLAYVAVLVRLAADQPAWLSGEARILQGVSAELLAGTTPGRQALVGSAWWGPLPLLAHLAAAFLVRALPAPAGLPAGVPLATLLSAACVAVGCLGLLRSPLPTDGLDAPRGTRPSVLLLGLAAVLPAALRLALGGTAAALVFPLALLLVLHGAAWVADGQLRNLVPAGFTMAALLLCGAEAWGWVLCGVLLLVLGALRRRTLARRLPALLLLGCLPAVYAFGVWVLLNWLILEDAGFFLRVLGTLPAPAWSSPGAWLPALPERLAAALCAVGVLWGLAARDLRRAAYALAGLAAALWLGVLTAFGLAWTGDATRLLLGICALLVVVRAAAVLGVRHPARALALQGLLLLLALLPLSRSLPPGGAMFSEQATFGVRRLDAALTSGGSTPSLSASLLDPIRRHVEAHGPHTRIFVCGYEGLGLLGGDRRAERFVPVLDLHLDALRRDYWGQTLFVLVRKPVGRARMESLLWRVPDFYLLGSSRTLLSADFGDWRLYEVIQVGQ